uniref:(northern house mosquito) hypothetical protein n=1 Tax=Culex pipiens TaxID=7175 RepID=A0A8D8K3K2_CULPI
MVHGVRCRGGAIVRQLHPADQLGGGQLPRHEQTVPAGRDRGRGNERIEGLLQAARQDRRGLLRGGRPAVVPDGGCRRGAPGRCAQDHRPQEGPGEAAGRRVRVAGKGRVGAQDVRRGGEYLRVRGFDQAEHGGVDRAESASAGRYRRAAGHQGDGV